MQVCKTWVVALVAAALCLVFVQSQPSQNPQPCVEDCLKEALTGDPVKGCPAGTVWIPHPYTNPKDACRPCPVGFYCLGVPYGEFSDLKVNLRRKIACPIGTYQDVEGTSRLDECKDCPTGRYQDWYGQSSCKLCPAGTYIDTVRSDSVRDCIPCPAGHFCIIGSPKPIPCSSGTFARQPRMRRVENCIPCPTGHYCPMGSVDPTPCPAGKYAEAIGTNGAGQYPGTYQTAGIITGDSCTQCPVSFFCPEGSDVPTSCPAGTTSGTSAKAEFDCEECPVGYRCQLPLDATRHQSLVLREANGAPQVGSVTPELCTVDTTVIHFSYPALKGCLEQCPNMHPHQSYCHVAGDGRLPDRSKRELRLGDLLAQRTQRSLATKVDREEALQAIDELLGNLTNVADRLGVLTLPDHNGRTPLLIAATLGDVEALQVLWRHGLVNVSSSASARDTGGFTALMLSLVGGHTETAAWLVNTMDATLAPSDLAVLQNRGIDVAGIPIEKFSAAPAYFGRGGLTWTHPKVADFVELPFPDNTDPDVVKLPFG